MRGGQGNRGMRAGGGSGVVGDGERGGGGCGGWDSVGIWKEKRVTGRVGSVSGWVGC